MQPCPVENCTVKRKTFTHRDGVIKHLKTHHPDYDVYAWREKEKLKRNKKAGRRTIEGEGAIVHSSLKFKVVNGQTVLVDESKEENSQEPTPGTSQSSAVTNPLPEPAVLRPVPSSTVVGGQITAAQNMTEQAVAGLAMYQLDQFHQQLNQEQYNQLQHCNIWQ